ncbi:unnamed protein product [Fusarium fujikuroi]|nr:unnamed protein product [Fusarium fujikuroi]
MTWVLMHQQAHSGIFQLLPLGLRVQDKIEKLIDKHMHSVGQYDASNLAHVIKTLSTGASRLSLSTISSEELWRKSDRLESVAPELFRLKDRKDTPLILSPTHEEEITILVAGIVNSYKDLPIRLYQIKPDRKTLINAWYPRPSGTSAESGLNLHAVKSAVPELDATIEDPLPLWGVSLESGTTKVINVVDGRLEPVFERVRDQLPLLPKDLQPCQVEYSTIGSTASGGGLNLARITDGDACPRCEDGALKIHRALECGHTFQLGTRYSVPLDACVTLPRSGIPATAAEEGLVPGSRIPLQMGCHGVGVSRIFGAVAEILADEQGLNWPRAIAPFEVAIIPTPDLAEDSLRIYDLLAAGDNSLPSNTDRQNQTRSESK